MEIDPLHLRNSRIKACTECRQQKLRCDAAQTPSSQCTRCRRRNIECVVTSNFTKTKRKTKSELQAELESLKNQVQSRPHISPHSQSNHSHTPSTAVSNVPPPFPEPNLGAITNIYWRQDTADVPPNSFDNTSDPTLPRTFGDVSVSVSAIDDCFGIFFAKYSPQLPAIEGEICPNDCYAQSPYLFWTIITIGSRIYPHDPTLLSTLVPHLTTMTKYAAFSREKSLNTIQAFMLLCTWPMPFYSLSQDITPILSGVLLQHTLGVGLHIFGVGQDFSRIKLQPDRAQMHFRARLWALCIVICQRVSCTDGVPPVYIPDNYDHEYCQAQSVFALPPALRFQKTLSRILTESILELERYALAKAIPHRAAVLNPIIDAASLSLAELEQECPAEIDRFYLICAELQILAFHLLGPKESFNDVKLIKMHQLACVAVEIFGSLERTDSFAEYAPNAALKYLSLAAFTLLKLSRSHLAAKFDLDRGKAAYFTAISVFRKSSNEADDIGGRSAKILTQLWTSKTIFKLADGTVDALSLRCGSRLAMSISFDCYWWWRSEFAGVPNPYEDKDQPQSAEGLTPKSFQSVAWLQESFPEFAWATMHDHVPMDWSTRSGPAPSLTPAPAGPTSDPTTIWM